MKFNACGVAFLFFSDSIDLGRECSLSLLWQLYFSESSDRTPRRSQKFVGFNVKRPVNDTGVPIKPHGVGLNSTLSQVGVHPHTDWISQRNYVINTMCKKDDFEEALLLITENSWQGYQTNEKKKKTTYLLCVHFKATLSTFPKKINNKIRNMDEKRAQCPQQRRLFTYARHLLTSLAYIKV